MSLNTQEQVRCPKCGCINDITLWQSITVSDSTDLKQELLQGRLNILECCECGAKALVPTPLLYNDEDKKLLFSLYPSTDPDDAWDKFETVRESAKRSGELSEYKDYTLRFVSNYNELLEKILIFDSGLFDKTVELIKLMVLMQEPDKAEKRSAFFGKRYEDGAIEIMVKDTDGNIFTSKTPPETYDIIHKELLNSGVKLESYGWEMVDRDYAARLLEGNI